MLAAGGMIASPPATQASRRRLRQQRNAPHCLNRCTQHGECVAPGLCRCSLGWYGLDCSSISTGFLDFRLFVHSPPEELGLDQMRRYGGDESYAAEMVFLNRLLSDWSTRTANLDEAKLFYVPTMLYYRLGNMVFRKVHTHISDIIREMLRSDSAFRSSWRRGRNASSRHVFFVTTDKGACSTRRGVDEPMYVSHWGLTVPWFEQRSPTKWVPNASDVRPEHQPCAVTEPLERGARRGEPVRPLTAAPSAAPSHGIWPRRLAAVHRLRCPLSALTLRVRVACVCRTGAPTIATSSCRL